MSDRYRLIALGNDELVAALSKLVRRENDLLSDMLAHLAELDQRRLYLELGFTSMFAYCTDALGLCKSSAYRRIAAARVCRRYPEVFGRVAAGELQTSVLAALSRHLTAENASELFAVCSRKSCEQVEELLAIRFPRPDVCDSIRRLPVRPAMGSRGSGSSTRNSRLNGRTPSQDRSPGAVTVDPPVSSTTSSSIGNSSVMSPGEVTADRTPGEVSSLAAVTGSPAAVQAVKTVEAAIAARRARRKNDGAGARDATPKAGTAAT